MSQQILDLINDLEKEYNPDNDLIPNTPTVTWADMSLLKLINHLLTKISDLEFEIEETKREIPCES